MKPRIRASFSAAEENPKGIPTQSPGLRGTSYPGFEWRRRFNPKGVVDPYFRRLELGCAGHPPHELSIADALATILPLPFGTGEGRGEGSVSSSSVQWPNSRGTILLAWLLLLIFTFSSRSEPRTKEDYRKFAMLKQGEVRNGQTLFADEQKLACSGCHGINGQGGKAGPDLFAIGDKFGRREIIDSLLSPSATIAEGYSATIIATKDGEEYTGVVK